MSKVDDTFDFANSLVLEWGQDAVFIRREGSAYDPVAGTVSQTETRTDVKIVISNLDITETGGLYQENDVKIIIDPVQLNYIYITEQDYFEVPKGTGEGDHEGGRPENLPRRQPCRLRDYCEAAVMVQRRPIKLPGLREYLEEIQQVTAREAATQIVGRLQFLGPWYSGQFAKNWVVRVGDVRIPATVEQGPVNKRVPRPSRSLCRLFLHYAVLEEEGCWLHDR